MNGQKPQCERLRSVAGFVLVGPGLFLLSAHLITAVGYVSRFLSQAAAVKLELVSSIMLAASLSPQHLAYAVLGTLWPVVLVLAGSAFLRESPKENAEPCLGCA